MSDGNSESKNEYLKAYYQKNKHRIKTQVMAKQAERRKWFKDYKKNLACEKCGEAHPGVLDFHHKPGAIKSGAVNDLVLHHSIEDTLVEMEKCEVLCANCHRKEHYKE